MGLRESLPSFLNNPYYVLLVSLASLIGVPLAIYFYFEGQQTRDLVFTVDPVRTVIARAGRPSELKVEFKGEIIKTDVIGAQVALWNQGKGSIHAGDVLMPLEIRLNPPTPILQASISKTSRNVIALALGSDTDMLRQGRVPVSFRILEKDDGGNVQIIYAGPSEVEISLAGVVEGARAPRNLQPAGVADARARRSTGVLEGLLLKIGFGTFVVWLVVMLIPGVIKNLRQWNPKSSLENIRLLAGLTQVLAAIVIAYLLFSTFRSAPTPPFGY